MISGRALGHTGGTLDKLEAIPGYRTALTLPEFETVLRRCGASIVSQTPELAPADRVLYALRDRTGTVENPGLICASILSKKLAAGLGRAGARRKDRLGRFPAQTGRRGVSGRPDGGHRRGWRNPHRRSDDRYGPAAGRMAGNWIELVECVELLRGQRPDGSEDLRELSLLLAGWMIHLGGKAETPESGYKQAESALADGSALHVFLDMVKAQGGDISCFDYVVRFHKPGATLVLKSWQSGVHCGDGHHGFGLGRTAARCRARKSRGGPSILTLASCSTPSAERRWSRNSHWPPYTPAIPKCSRSRWSCSCKRSTSPTAHRKGWYRW